MINVIGGCYLERCLTPHREELFGSAGRAAVALKHLTNIKLHTFFPKDVSDDVLFNFGSFGIETEIFPSPAVIEFHYNFPLSSPRIAPVPIPFAATQTVTAENVLKFNTIEAEVISHANLTVYDPQSGSNTIPFHSNGSTTARLAIVLNKDELFQLSPASTIDDAVKTLSDQPDVVVVKSGPHGSRVYEGGKYSGTVPVYDCSNVYKIGTGDIFSAYFAHHWIQNQISVLDCADIASRAVSAYVESGRPENLSLVSSQTSIKPSGNLKRIYLAGPFFSTCEVWQIEEVFRALKSFGLDVFSPYHHVGLGTGKDIAKADIVGLQNCEVMLALLDGMDPGTITEIGYARGLDKKVIVHATDPTPQHMTMISGLNCESYHDLATAIYKSVWACL